MPSKEVYDRLLKEGYRVDKNCYERYDSLATEDDLTALFEVLDKHTDCKGHRPVITANCVVANPDFENIKANGYQSYYYEPFTETLKRYPHCERSFELWKQGMRAGMFQPQFIAGARTAKTSGLLLATSSEVTTTIGKAHPSFSYTTTISMAMKRIMTMP